jgi:hypothetical protein
MDTKDSSWIKDLKIAVMLRINNRLLEQGDISQRLHDQTQDKIYALHPSKSVLELFA